MGKKLKDKFKKNFVEIKELALGGKKRKFALHDIYFKNAEGNILYIYLQKHQLITNYRMPFLINHLRDGNLYITKEDYNKFYKTKHL